ncbi:MAG: GTPase domain-containing protein, partial [Treponema sp.]|nr:GTPase domain-containing protein [Treponema sp.]
FKKEKQVVLIMGQAGHGKTTLTNRLLNTAWNTCAYDTGTTLPFIKSYIKKKNGCREIIMEPYIDKRRADIELSWLGVSKVCMHQKLIETVRWEVTNDTITHLKLNEKYDTITFVDLMGIGDSILTNEHYNKIYREFATYATQIIWVTDACRRGYLEDIKTLKYIYKILRNINKIIICLNKVDAIAKEKDQELSDAPTQYQQNIIREKIIDVFGYFSKIFSNDLLTIKDIIPLSAKTGWNFEALQGLFFI